MPRPVVTTIKKLLRLARCASTRAEGALAQARAEELMHKHGVIVEASEAAMRRVEGVAGVFWREALLAPLAGFYGCELRNDHDRAAVLVADDPSYIEAAFVAYKALERRLVMRCTAEWRMHLARLRIRRWREVAIGQEANADYDRRLAEFLSLYDPSLFTEAQLELVRQRVLEGMGGRPVLTAETLENESQAECAWHSVFLGAAATVFGDALRKSTGRKPPTEPSPRGHQRQESEKEKIAGELGALMGEIGQDAALAIVQVAQQCGGNMGSALMRELLQSGRRQIAVASTWLPPLPLPIHIPMPLAGIYRSFDSDGEFYGEDDPEYEDDGAPESVQVVAAAQRAESAPPVTPAPPAEPPKDPLDTSERFSLIETGG